MYVRVTSPLHDFSSWERAWGQMCVHVVVVTHWRTQGLSWCSSLSSCSWLCQCTDSTGRQGKSCTSHKGTQKDRERENGRKKRKRMTEDQMYVCVCMCDCQHVCGIRPEQSERVLARGEKLLIQLVVAKALSSLSSSLCVSLLLSPIPILTQSRSPLPCLHATLTYYKQDILL